MEQTKSENTQQEISEKKKPTKKKKVIKVLLKIFIPIIAILVVLGIGLQIAGFGAFFGLYEPQSNSKYPQVIEDYGVWDNTIDTAIPQTAMHKIVMDHFNAPLPAGKTVKKVLFMGFDGCRTDTIPNIQDDPNSAIMYIKSQGGLYHTFSGGITGQSEQPTSTAPSWCSMLTGGWAALHGVEDNGYEKNDAETFLTTLAKQGHAGSFTISWREHLGLTYRPDVAKAINENLPIEYKYCVDDSDTYYQVLKYVAKSKGQQKTAQEDPDVIFFTFESPDHNGHLYGFGNNDNYKQGSLDANYFGKKVIDTIEARDSYAQEDWLIIVTTDHGGTGHTHGGQTQMERQTWMATNKKLDITDDYLTYDLSR